jgi:hypothetical protein
LKEKIELDIRNGRMPFFDLIEKKNQKQILEKILNVQQIF